MKKRTYLMLMLLLSCMLTIGWSTKAEAKEYDSTGYKYTDTTITIQWDDPTELYSYIETSDLISFRIYDAVSKKDIVTDLAPGKRSYKKTGLKKGYVSYWQIYFQFQYGDTVQEFYYDSIYVNTTPKKVLKANFSIFSLSSSRPSCDFVTITDDNMTGFQLQLYKGSTKVKTLSSTTYYTSKYTFKENAVYKYRVRQYYKNPDTAKKCYGAWSSYRYFVSPDVSLTSNNTKRGCDIKVKKISGVTKYVVYVSKYKNKNFKKTATITPTSAYKTVHISKIGTSSMQKGVYYYVKIKPYIKAGTSTVASDIVVTSDFYNRK